MPINHSLNSHLFKGKRQISQKVYFHRIEQLNKTNMGRICSRKMALWFTFGVRNCTNWWPKDLLINGLIRKSCKKRVSGARYLHAHACSLTNVDTYADINEFTGDLDQCLMYRSCWCRSNKETGIYTSDEARLVQGLCSRLNDVSGALSRPVLNSSQSVEVQFTINLYQIVSINDKSQTLSAKMWKDIVSIR